MEFCGGIDTTSREERVDCRWWKCSAAEGEEAAGGARKRTGSKTRVRKRAFFTKKLSLEACSLHKELDGKVVEKGEQ